MSQIRSYIILTIVGIVLLVVGYIFAYNYFNSTDLTITTKNISSFNVKLSGATIHTSTENTSTVRVPMFSNVSIEFKGTEGYETGTREVSIGKSPKSITIEPFYSREHLAALVSNEKTQIDATVSSYQQNIDKLYSLEDQTLYHFGEWASVVLKWRGEYSQNSDDLVVILKKESDSWSIIGEPSIIFFSKNYPEIPIDILRSVNNLRV